MDIKLPAIDKEFYPNSAVPQNQKVINSIKSQYGTIISNVSNITNVREDIIISFIFIESAGQSNVVSGAGACGLMQLTPDAATNAIFYEYSKKRLLPTEQALITKHIGTNRFTCITKMRYFSDKLPCNNNTGRVITKEDLLNPEFNILMGAMLLGQLIDQETNNGVLRMDKVVIRYNKGYFSKPKGDTIAETISSVPTETKMYVYKLLGTNGILSIA